MPSSRSTLLATWLYSDIASTPTASPSLRMLSDSTPVRSASATAASSTRSRLSWPRAGFAMPITSLRSLTTLRRKSTTYGVSSHRIAEDGSAMDSTKRGTRRMSAIVQERYGADPHAVLRFGETGTPSPGRDEVLVRVHAASVDRGTWHVMAGLPYPIRLAGFGVRRPR